VAVGSCSKACMSEWADKLAAHKLLVGAASEGRLGLKGFRTTLAATSRCWG
jgi:hypothetical protein